MEDGFLEGGGFAEPALLVGFSEPELGVRFDVVEQRLLGRVEAEQDLRLACAVADEVVVMEKGTVALRRATSEFRRDGAPARRLVGVA